MRDVNTKKSKLSWSKSLVRKWFNIKGKTEEFPEDSTVYGVCGNSFTEREPCTMKKSETERFSKHTEGARQGNIDLEHLRIADVQNYSVFVATWNVAGKSPTSNLNLDDWLHASSPADIYVLGFQEIVPLNASNVLGTEDNGPAKKWLRLIRKTLNNHPGTSGTSGCYTPSPIPNPIVELNADFEGSARQVDSSFFPRRSFQANHNWRMENDPSIPQPRLDRRFSMCDRMSNGHRPGDFDPNLRWGHRPSDYSRWGSSDDDYGPGDSPSTVLFSPMSYSGSAPTEDGNRMPAAHSKYCLVARKQMVGLFLTIWVRSDLRDHVRNMKVSCVGRGLMGYLGNKGSISVSMLLHESSFCFVCTHLTSGQKDGDEIRRNSDVMEILRKTRFPRVYNVGDEKSPETILEHDRVVWLGDLNYRIALSYRSAKALVEMQNWRQLLKKDQLRLEQRHGRVFEGWREGKIYFAPTYKYSTNSDRYAGDDMQQKEKRRACYVPFICSWTSQMCDRILWYGEGLHQLSYVRGESRFSDHRPVYAIFCAEVELFHEQINKSMSSSGLRIQPEDQLSYDHGYTEPYADGYTELSFF